MANSSKIGRKLFLLAELLSLVESVAGFIFRHGIRIVFVLVGHHDQPDGRRTLTSNHGAPGKEDFVKAVSTLVVLLDNSIFVFD